MTAQPIVIIGGGITGLTLALSLHEAAIACRIFESAPAFKPLGVGINLLPHGVRELTQLGLLPDLAARGVETRDELLHAARPAHLHGAARPVCWL
jgi:5-methylphenazine-1-carboxylate 1-monooxygenase